MVGALKTTSFIPNTECPPKLSSALHDLGGKLQQETIFGHRVDRRWDSVDTAVMRHGTGSSRKAAVIRELGAAWKTDQAGPMDSGWGEQLPSSLFDLRAAVEEIGRLRSILNQVPVLADDAPGVTDRELRERLAALGERARR